MTKERQHELLLVTAGKRMDIYPQVCLGIFIIAVVGVFL